MLIYVGSSVSFSVQSIKKKKKTLKKFLIQEGETGLNIDQFLMVLMWFICDTCGYLVTNDF